MKDFFGYKVSSCGCVFNKDGSEKRQFKAGKSRAYNYVCIYLNGTKKNISVHRLVAMLYLPNPCNLPEVNHIDGNKENNVFTNLEWCTMEHNLRHAQLNNLHHNPCVKVLQYKEDILIDTHSSIRECAISIGVNESSIRKACKGMFLVKGFRFCRSA